MLNVMMVRPYEDFGGEFSVIIVGDEWLGAFNDLPAFPQENGFQAIESDGYFFMVYPAERMKEGYEYLKEFYLDSESTKMQMEEQGINDPQGFWNNHIYGFDSVLWEKIHGTA